MNWLEAADLAGEFWDENSTSLDSLCMPCIEEPLRDSEAYGEFEYYDDDLELLAESPLSPHINPGHPSIRLSDISSLPISSRKRKIRNIWTAEEDDLLGKLSKKYKNNWNKISKHFPNKSVASIQKRWTNRHDPNIKKTKWTAEEDQIILNLYEKYGGNWKRISKSLPGRPADAVKNRFYGSIKKKLPPEERQKYSRKSSRAPSNITLKMPDISSIEGTYSLISQYTEDALVNSFLANSDSDSGISASEFSNATSSMNMLSIASSNQEPSKSKVLLRHCT